MEKAGAFENLKVIPEKIRRQATKQVLQDLKVAPDVYRVEGFSCANCAGKFEKNVKDLPGVQDAKVNFGASKISVFGETTVEELEKAGAFEKLKVTPEKPKHQAPQKEI